MFFSRVYENRFPIARSFIFNGFVTLTPSNYISCISIARCEMRDKRREPISSVIINVNKTMLLVLDFATMYNNIQMNFAFYSFPRKSAQFKRSKKIIWWMTKNERKSNNRKRKWMPQLKLKRLTETKPNWNDGSLSVNHSKLRIWLSILVTNSSRFHFMHLAVAECWKLVN